MTAKVCAGCGEDPKGYPIVAVLWDNEAGGFVAKPVCKACHDDPAHRKNPLKAHFHPLSRAGVAVALAGRSDITMEK